MASPGKKAYPLRIDPALWEEIQRLAARDLRSVNAEIEFLLREGLARRGVKLKGEGAGTNSPAADHGDSPEPAPE
ncbi:hypothetical protein [Pseudoduganella aquatica]|uniref:Toxin-antitoxin system HicB family antitoxin n=1 Tax=Pseudoduganella aquatica TaxID=2660641 RepID=A0A7X4HCT1_9BURK|nr:hypothetical protein [Pseudoduganella aquatica]MYN08423.1 hypothetical protein [Pseudoduganella aquatica]